MDSVHGEVLALVWLRLDCVEAEEARFSASYMGRLELINMLCMSICFVAYDVLNVSCLITRLTSLLTTAPVKPPDPRQLARYT